jgi:hypothetical protein
VQVYLKKTGRCMNLTIGILSPLEAAMTKRTCGPRFQSTLHALLLCLIHALQPLEEAHQKDALENQLYHVNCLVSRGLAYYTQQHHRFSFVSIPRCVFVLLIQILFNRLFRTEPWISRRRSRRSNRGVRQHCTLPLCTIIFQLVFTKLSNSAIHQRQFL